MNKEPLPGLACCVVLEKGLDPGKTMTLNCVHPEVCVARDTCFWRAFHMIPEHQMRTKR